MLALYLTSKHKSGQQLVKHSKLQEGELMLLADAWNASAGRNYSQRLTRGGKHCTWGFKCGRAEHIQRRV